jgi:RNase adaptor protein for sRNA GlmZ degradation
MRTTLTLDPDVAMKLKKRMADKKLTFKETVNEALRYGLKEVAKEKKRAPFKVIPHSFGFKPGIDQNKLGQLLDQLDAEEFVRKMNL